MPRLPGVAPVRYVAAMSPDAYDRLQALFKRFDDMPEVRWTDDGAVLSRGAYTAFLDARQLIEREVCPAVYEACKGWRPIATFFDAEPETPYVPLWQAAALDGEQLQLGYWDDDEQAWYRPGEGASEESEPLRPTHWMPQRDLLRLAGGRSA